MAKDFIKETKIVELTATFYKSLYGTRAAKPEEFIERNVANDDSSGREEIDDKEVAKIILVTKTAKKRKKLME